MGWGRDAQIAYGGMFPAEQQPLLFQSIIAIPGNLARPLTVDRLMKGLNPGHFDPNAQFMELSVQFHEEGNPVDIEFATTTRFDGYIDTLAAALKSHARPTFLRIGLEVNGPWNGYTPWTFPAAYRKLVEALRQSGVDNIATVWCYEPDALPDFADSTEQGWKWYPGDDTVDWFGLDPFDADHFDPALPDSTGSRLTKKGRTEAFLRFAEERGKPVYLNELSARHVHIVPDSHDPGFLLGKEDWEGWFEPFFEFLEAHPSIKAFNYIDLEWTQIPQYATWGDARIEINTYIRERWISRLSGRRFLHLGTGIGNPARVNPPKERVYPNPGAVEISAFPNPFNDRLTVRLNLPCGQSVRVQIIDVRGRRIDSLFGGFLPHGSHTIYWVSGTGPSGIHFVRIEGENVARTQKILLVR